MFDLKGRWALVTGASSGIGAALAVEIAKAGGNLVLVARQEQALEQLAGKLASDYQIETRVKALDLSREEAPGLLADFLLDLPISVIVNNAGVGCSGRFPEMDGPRVRAMLALNVYFPTEFCRLMIPRLLARGEACRILNVGSIAGNQGVPWFLPYAATKAYINMFSEGLNWELRGTPVVVTCLEPGSTHSEFFRNASMEGSFMSRVDVMTAASVARLGIAGMVRGKARVVPGFTNKMRVWSLRVTPRWLVRESIRLMFRDLK